MRRDVCYYFDTDVLTLYKAYLSAAVNPPFGRSCTEQYGRSFGFGISSSFKYNMNGGACTLHFMSYQNGAAVNLRFSIAQLVGARYEKYAEDLTAIVEKNLHIPAQRRNIDVNEFINAPAPAAPSPAPAPAPAPAPVAPTQPVTQQPAYRAPAASAPADVTCSRCQNPIGANDAFCRHCGTPVARQNFCPRCGAKTAQSDRFCAQCGQRL